jgi:hypothetical protein
MGVRLEAFSQHFGANQVGILPSVWRRHHIVRICHCRYTSHILRPGCFRLLGNQDTVQFRDMKGIYFHVNAARRQYIQKPARSWLTPKPDKWISICNPTLPNTMCPDASRFSDGPLSTKDTPDQA